MGKSRARWRIGLVTQVYIYDPCFTLDTCLDLARLGRVRLHLWTPESISVRR
jgi:hypothetical protein